MQVLDMTTIVQAIFIGCLGWVIGYTMLFCADRFFLQREEYQARAGSRRLSSWLVALVYVLASLWTWFNRPSLLGYASDLVLLFYLGMVWTIDQQTRLIPNLLSAAGLVIGLLTGSLRHGLADTLVGGLVGFSLSLGLFLFGIVFIAIYRRWRGQNFSEVAFGFGDVLLGSVIGLIVGWPLIINSLLISILLAGLVSLLYLGFKLATRSYTFGLAIPYAPFLILGAFVVIYIQPVLAKSAFFLG